MTIYGNSYAPCRRELINKRYLSDGFERTVQERKQIWNNAIGHIKSGGSPRSEDLLNIMIEDFSFDDSLKQLKKIIFQN